MKWNSDKRISQEIHDIHFPNKLYFMSNSKFYFDVHQSDYHHPLNKGCIHIHTPFVKWMVCSECLVTVNR